ncbi:DNA repair protein RecO [Mycoplasmatota bacterium]|nr:DNA repair protein RecO [Mycoplasmatota bacterium]
MEIIEGIILKQMNYKESSKIIHVYSPKGLVSVLVHGSNKLKSPYLNLVRVFSHVKLNVSGKELKTLRDGEVLNYNSEIALDVVKYTYSLHLMEVINYFSHHEHDHEKLYYFILKIVEEIKNNQKFEVYIMMAELKLLYLLGVQPMLKHCVFCDSQEGLTFSVKDGGMLCSNHRQTSSYRSTTMHLLITLYYFDLSHPIEIHSELEDIVALRKLIDEYYEYHLNYQSRSRKLLRDLIGY